MNSATNTAVSEGAGLLEQGRALCREDKFEQGIELFKQLTAAEPNNAAAHNFMGMAFDRIGKPLEALACFDRAIAADPNFADALANKADALSALGRFREAVKLYDQALGIDPGNAFAWFNRGVAFYATSEYEAALISIDRGLSLDPENFLGISNRARILGALERYEEQAACLRGFLAIEPENLEATIMLGSALLRQERAGEALEQFDKALARDPQLFSAHVGRGHALTALDRPGEAVASYDAASAMRDDIGEVHAGRSIALARAGRREDALTAIDRAIALDAGAAKYHSHRALLLRHLGRNEDAAKSIDAASALSASDPLFHFNQGMALLKKNDLKKARECFARTLELHPKMVDAMLALSEIAIQEKEHGTALSYALRALGTKETKETRSFFIERILGLGLAAQTDEFRSALIKAISEVWRLPRQLFPYAAILIRNGPAKSLIEDALRQWPQPFSASKNATPRLLPDIFKDRLFLCTLAQTQFAHVEFEKFLTLLRRHLLEMTLTPDAIEPEPYDALEFASALAQQCCINEYVFKVDEDEQAQLQKLVSELKSESARDVHALFRIAVAGAYVPLRQIFGSRDFQSIARPSSFANLITLQLDEPERLERIRAEIPRLTEIDDKVSIAVREQYEESPYPRWIRMPDIPQAQSVEQDLQEQFPSATIQPRGRDGVTDVLVAGCGTGRQLQFSTRYPNSSVLAVDLSLSSLSYAKMKMDELGEKRVSFGHADILKLGSLGRTFDVIFSTGVLHHMQDPEAGWDVLLSLLKPAGFMHIGLYSEFARADIVKARQAIAERKLEPTAGNIRRFRQEIGFSEWSPLSKISAMSDFFTLNETRDLLFHAHEENFTIPRIARYLAENNLAFLGFSLPPDIEQKFMKSHPGKSLQDLDAWHEYEQQHPDTFIGMYNFWVQKRKPH